MLTEIPKHFRPGPFSILLSFFLLAVMAVCGQETFPVNGVADPRNGSFAFIHARIYQNGQTVLFDGTLLIRDGIIVQAAKTVTIPAGTVVIDCSGKCLYPSFIDIYTDYGMPQSKAAPPFNFFTGQRQISSDTKGAYGWNQAIKPETEGFKLFTADEPKAEGLRALGFGTVLSHRKDGIARGTGTLVTLASKKENFLLVKERASAHYSFSKGSSQQGYPSSLMGVIALLRQTYLDAEWYKSRPASEGTNISLQSWNDEQALPQIFEANDKWNDLRALRVGREFGVKYIIKGGGNEYQRISEIAASGASFILPLNFPQAMNLEDPNWAEAVPLSEMKHWELAPGNPAAFEKANIPFCLTSSDLSDPKQFLPNLKKAMEYGLSAARALDALTQTPARLLGIYDKLGSLEPGKLANFLVTDGPIFEDSVSILENWIQGEKYTVKTNPDRSVRGIYLLHLNPLSGQPATYQLLLDKGHASLQKEKDTLAVVFKTDGRLVSVVSAGSKAFPRFRLSGTAGDSRWIGNGLDSNGAGLTWWMERTGALTTSKEGHPKKMDSALGKIYYPFNGYGWEEMPKAEDMLIRNATVWTNEAEGILPNTDVLIKNGKIAAVGKNLQNPGALVIDGTGKHLTPGIVDEHSHIAAVSINEGGQSVTSEVRMGDILNPEDISIYRQLSGGVTTSHILHGSANTIGGQTQLIKLRWGVGDEALKFGNNDPFIKFALGENVKRTYFSTNNRFPDTRMGVPEVVADAFQRAKDYENALKTAAASKTAPPVRRDLELDALVEILHQKRFITCHSYVQSEVISMMRIAEQYGFRVNTFTHILEGYKIADKLKAHGANASTFSDWWTYKMEVLDAIAYNAAIMQKAGLNVCINSDDAEMGRRLNQEAAKTVKYGGVSEEDAFKMVTLNPAKALHIENRVGSIRTGKDADLVLWSDHPLSIYAKPLKTIIDGIIYYDIEKDALLRDRIRHERNRLIQKMSPAKLPG
jgi:imidazolonepropionase-like amidohydrolase